MADISDVLDTLSDVISGILYPNGAESPSIISGVNNIFVYAGWPRPFDLENDIKINNAHVTIFQNGNERDATKYPESWNEQTINAATLTATLLNNKVTIGGTVSVPQAVMIVVNGIGYSYQVIELDTLNTIASALSLLIPSSTVLANVITINGAFSIIPRITVGGTVIQEVMRQQTNISVITWANSRAHRTAIAAPIKAQLGKLKRFELPDGYYASLIYSGAPPDHDELQKSIPIYRRDLTFRVEYATTQTMEAFTITDTLSSIELVKQLS